MSEVAHRPESRVLQRKANALRIDAWTTDVIGALDSAGVPSVLLKGPVTCAWLYDGDRGRRSYDDADLLIPADRFAPARRALAGLGFVEPERHLLNLDLPLHAEIWFRPGDRAAVDLHRTLHDVEGPSAGAVWDLVWSTSEPFDLEGAVVRQPGEPVRALHAVLHVRAKDDPTTKAWRDLVLALERCDRSTWAQVRGLAEELDVVEEVRHTLALLPGGLDAVGFDAPVRPRRDRAVLRDPGAPPSAHLLARLGGVRWRTRVRVLCAALFPPPDLLRRTDPRFATGRRRLVTAYAARVASFVPKSAALASYAFGIRRRRPATPAAAHPVSGRRG